MSDLIRCLNCDAPVLYPMEENDGELCDRCANDEPEGTERYPYRELREAFDSIACSYNWKNPIAATIDADRFDVCNEAAIFFAGSPLRVELEFVDDFGARRMHVNGAGYYRMIGA